MMVPYLADPNAGEEMFKSAHIVAYLEKTYGKGQMTRRPIPWPSLLGLSLLALGSACAGRSTQLPVELFPPADGPLPPSTRETLTDPDAGG